MSKFLPAFILAIFCFSAQAQTQEWQTLSENNSYSISYSFANEDFAYVLFKVENKSSQSLTVSYAGSIFSQGAAKPIAFNNEVTVPPNSVSTGNPYDFSMDPAARGLGMITPASYNQVTVVIKKIKTQ